MASAIQWLTLAYACLPSWTILDKGKRMYGYDSFIATRVDHEVEYFVRPEDEAKAAESFEPDTADEVDAKLDAMAEVQKTSRQVPETQNASVWRTLAGGVESLFLGQGEELPSKVVVEALATPTANHRLRRSQHGAGSTMADTDNGQPTRAPASK
jgi:hypothetical protein